MDPSPSTSPFRVVAIVATYRRAFELSRLIASLDRAPVGMRGLLVVDNADDPATGEAIAGSRLDTEWVRPGKNLGCGGGLRLAEESAMKRFPDYTHLWILDDDAVVEPATVVQLAGAMASAGAAMGYPMISDKDGKIGWFPGLLDQEKFRIIREGLTPAEFLARCGPEPIPFSWASGVALMVSREAMETYGLHRDDYWVRGEDLEFSLRITHKGLGICVPEAVAAHLPPEPAPGAAEASLAAEYVKHRAMIQNIAYTSFRMRHGARIIRNIPGNLYRFFNTWGWTPRVIWDGITALWTGGIRALPAGLTPH